MTHRYIKIGATALVLVLAFTGMLWSTLREGAVHDKQLQLHGYVVPNSILVKKSTLEYTFKVQNNPARAQQAGGIIDVTYKGIVPDTFKDEAEVVLKGK